MKKYYFLFSFTLFIFACGNNDEEVLLCGPCNLVPDSGPCEAAIPRYYFDQSEWMCKEFTWGGCDGVVPFETLELCQSSCE